MHENPPLNIFQCLFNVLEQSGIKQVMDGGLKKSLLFAQKRQE